MKSEQALKSSAQARLQQAIEANERIHKHLIMLQQDGKVEKHLPVIRAVAPMVLIYASEYSAYHNALHTT
jgi:hypothetical protein